MKTFLKFLLFLVFSQIASAKPMLHRPFIADLSDHLIKIDTRFNGTDVLLFGARNDPGDIVVVIRGPKKSYAVRKKGKIAGIWLTKEQIVFPGVESFYTVASSNPLKIIKNDYIFKEMGIGLENLAFTNESSARDDFEKALIKHKIDNNLYKIQIMPISFIGNALFRIKLRFPENIIPGAYVAEVYLFNNGQLTAIQSTPIHIRKTGLDASIYRNAQKHYILYGMFAVLMALAFGLIGNWLFKKF